LAARASTPIAFGSHAAPDSRRRAL
jgi:hypothetical protein